MKKWVKITIVIFLIGFIIAPIFFFAFVYIVFLIGSNVTYYRHRPIHLYQTDYVFSDNLGNTYFSKYKYCYRYRFEDDKSDNYEPAFHTQQESPYCRKAATNDDYIFVWFQDGNYKHFIRVYDKNLLSIKEWAFEDDKRPVDFVEGNNLLFCIVKNTSTSKKSLLSISPFEDKEELLIDNIDAINVYNNNDVTIFIDSTSGRLAISNEKTMFCNGRFGDVYQPIITNENISIKFQNSLSTFPNNYGVNCFYEKAYLINGYLLFAAYERIDNKECGSNGGLCFCNLGKSYLFSLSLFTKETMLIKEFEYGSFLIDYDLEQIEYYRDGELYINELVIKSCEKIEVGSLEKIKGQSYFSSDEAKSYYFSYHNGEFYGV